MKRLLALLLLLATPAYAQSVQQSGTVTPGHPVAWTTNGVVQDAGTAVNGFLTSLGVVASGVGVCQNSGPITGPYNQACLSVTSSALSLNFTNVAGATGFPQLCINGVCNAFVINQPGNITTSITAPVRSSAAATVTVSATTDYFLCLDPTNNAIQVNLPSSPATGLSYLVKDCTGQAALHSITVTPASGLIDNASNFVISLAHQSIGVTYTGAQWSIN
jgi:hypothetical protein